MQWLLFVFLYTLSSFCIFFILICIALGGYSLLYSKINFGEFQLYLDYVSVLFLSFKISVLVFFSITLHVILVKIPNSKKFNK